MVRNKLRLGDIPVDFGDLSMISFSFSYLVLGVASIGIYLNILCRSVLWVALSYYFESIS